MGILQFVHISFQTVKDKEPRQRFQSRTQDELETVDLLLSLLGARQQWKCLVPPPRSDY